ncbi:SpoIIE family protein phosphatase [Nonomuraea maritima]|uniref:SpoIIE family protein phosphatase n=1 Tax=Nonomuraea maritima TaxID=683260 RepID=UPI00371B3672
MGDAETRSRNTGATLDIFDAVPVGVSVTSGRDHRLIYLNPAYRAIVGERRCGRPMREVFADLRQERYFALLDQVYATGEAVRVEEMPLRLSGRDERLVSVGVLKIALGSEQGLLIATAEVTAAARSARALDPVAAERRRYLQRYQSLLQLETQAVWVASPVSGIVEPSPDWQRYTGQTWEEFRGRGWLNAVHPDDREAAAEIWLHEVERESRVAEQIYRVRVPGGAYRHVRVRGVPIVEDGEIVEWVGTVADVEQEWQEQRRRELLDRAGRATAGLGSPEEVLRALAEVIVPTVSDSCGVYVLPEFADHSIPLPFVADRVAAVVRTGEPPPSREVVLDAEGAFVQVVRTRRPVLRDLTKGDPPRGMPPGTSEWCRAAGANSIALLPVLVDGVVAAVVTATACRDREPIGAADIDLLGRMLDHAHAHLSNAMRFQRTQRVALALQNYLLPEPPRVPGLEIAARYRPSVTVAQIGGDWYDSFVSPDGATVLTIGDVAGHDLAAAVTMSQLRNMLRGLSMDRKELPGDTMRRLNIATELLCHEGTATCVLARLEYGDAWRLTYSVAGHPPPLLVTYEGAASYLEDGANLMLGVGYDMPRTSAVATLPPRSTLLLYTDGLVEVPGEHLDVGLERLRRAAASLAREPLDCFCDMLLTQLPTARKDDIAMIAVRLPVAAVPG